MDTYKTKNTMSFDEANQQNWYLSVRPTSPKQLLTVRFEDGKTYKYIGKGRVNVEDVVIPDFGGVTSYQMGNVDSIGEGVAGKKAYTLNALYSFSTDPEKTEIKKNVERMNCLEAARTGAKVSLKLDSPIYGPVQVIDYLVMGVLSAITVVAYPNLSSQETVNQAKALLRDEISISTFLFGSKLNYVPLRFVDDIAEEFWDDTPAIIFSGHYPGWKKSFGACRFWGEESLGIEKKWDADKNVCYMLFSSGFSSKAAEAYFAKDKEFQGVINELVFRSALSILIRGGFTNLLKAAVSVEMPIQGFKKRLIQFANAIGSTECCNILKGGDSKKTPAKDGEAAKPTVKKATPKYRQCKFTFKDPYREKMNQTKPFTIMTIDGEDYLGDVPFSALEHVLANTGKNTYQISFLPPGFRELQFKKVVFGLDIPTITRQLAKLITDLEFNAYSPLTEELIANQRALDRYLTDALAKTSPEESYKARENAMRRWPKGVKPYKGTYTKEQSLGLLLQFLNQLCALSEDEIRELMKDFPTISSDKNKAATSLKNYPVVKGSFFMADPYLSLGKKPKTSDEVRMFWHSGIPALVVNGRVFCLATLPFQAED